MLTQKDCQTFWAYKIMFFRFLITDESGGHWRGQPLHCSRGVWGHAPPENFEILVLWNAISSVLRGQILSKMFSLNQLSFLCLFLLAWLRVEIDDFILYFVRFLKLSWIYALSAKYTDSMCLAPARFLCQSAGDCTRSVALELHAILVGNVADWSFQIMGS